MKNQIKYIGPTLLMLLFSIHVVAQETAKAAATTEGVAEFRTTMQTVFFAVIAVLALASAFIALRTINLYREMLSTTTAKLEGREIPVPVAKPESESIVSKIWYQLTGTGAVAIEKEKDIMIEHPHDGIYELDNRLPPWWVNMFYACIVWGIGYLAYYHYFDSGKLQLDEYKDEMRVAEIEKAQAADRAANAVNENNVTVLADQAALDLGKNIFVGKCAACHGQKGEGGVGPNMTDEYWIHGGSIKNVFRTVTNGVPEKGMIAWNTQLRPAEIQAVSSYILTLKGTNPPNAKAPEGDIYKEQ